MSAFNNLYKKEPIVNRTYEIDESLYNILETLSQNVYDASINKLVNISIEFLLNTKNVQLYYRERKEISVPRSFLIRKSLLDGLFVLKENYNVSLNRLVNIAIRNALIDEGFIRSTN